jgi:hypothetical protein
VREQLRDGADLVKTCQTGAAAIHAGSRVDVSEWTMEGLRALVDGGHRLGVRVAVHAHGPRGIREAVAAGADTIEHGTWLDDEGARMMEDLAEIARERYARGLVDRRTFLAGLALAGGAPGVLAPRRAAAAKELVMINLVPGVWIVPQGNPAGKDVYRFIASTQDPRRQVEMLVGYGYGTVNPAAAPLVPEAQRWRDPDNLKRQVFIRSEWRRGPPREVAASCESRSTGWASTPG